MASRPILVGFGAFLVWCCFSLLAYQRWVLPQVQASPVSEKVSRPSAEGQMEDWSAPALGEQAARSSVKVFPNGLTVWQSGEPLWSLLESVTVQLGSPELNITPLASVMLDSTAAWLSRDSSLVLIIISRYALTEAPAFADADPGLVRGDALRRALAFRGIKPGRSNVLSRADSTAFNNGQSPFDLVFVPASKSLAYLAEHANQEGTTAAAALSINRHWRFPYGQAILPLDSATTRDFQKLSEYLNQHPDRLVDVTGYTCNISSAAFNKRLGMARAEAVRDRLVALDVAPERIRVASGGEENPLADNQTTAGQEANRRVDLLIR